MNCNSKISIAYNSALEYARKRYENFPVVSLLIPKDLRNHVAIIYWFARTADDLADEGNLNEEDRLKQLNDFETSFSELLKGKCNSPFEEALNKTISEKNLSPQLFYDLLTAFKQDVVKKRYLSFERAFV